MADTFAILNALSEPEARAALARCCGASKWVSDMLARRPFASQQELRRSADEAWAACAPADILEAFSHHPKIGESLSALREKFQTTSGWSEAEQAGVNQADEATLLALQAGNRRYEAKFGFIFIVCATGKSAAEMLALLEARLPNEAEHELRIAAAEQAKITHLRLEKLS